MEDVIGTGIPTQEQDRDGDGDVTMAPEAGHSSRIQFAARDELMNAVFFQIVILSPSFPPIIRPLDLPSTRGCLLRKVTQEATMIS